MNSDDSSAELNDDNEDALNAPRTTEAVAVENNPQGQTNFLQKPWLRLASVTVLVLGMGTGGLLGLRASHAQDNTASRALTDVKSQTVALPELSNELASKSATQPATLKVNGQVVVGDTLVLQGTDRPTKPVAGQLYYDKANKVLTFYNGNDYVGLLGGNVINTQNTYAPITNNTYTTVVNSTTVAGGGASLQGTTGKLAVFAVGNQLQDALIGQSGNDLTVGEGSGAVAIQAGSGGIMMQTAASNSSTDNITVRTGNSATTTAGNVDIDTGTSIVTGTVVANKGFESGLDNMVDGFGFSDAVVNSTTQAHSGTHAMEITTGAGGFGFFVGENAPFVIPVTAGHSYRFSAWVRAQSTARTLTFRTDFSSTGYSGGGTVAVLDWGTVSAVSTGWTQVSVTLVAPASSIAAGVQIYGFTSPQGEINYIDDLVVTDLSSSSAQSLITIGALNAQGVTIGNANQLLPTTIKGSGISVNGGLGNVNIGGGSIAITGGGISNFTTTAGDLTLQGQSGLNLLTQAVSATSGGIIIQTGNSNTTASGNISIDSGTGVITGTVVGTKTFESDAENMHTWFNTVVSTSSAQARTGANSLAVDLTAVAWGAEENQNSLGTSVTAGHQYYFSAWVRAGSNPRTINASIAWTGGGSPTVFNPVVDSASAWTEMTLATTAPAGATRAYFVFSGSAAAGETHYFDDFTVTDLSASAAFSAIEIGKTNAKAVTIGNMNQIQTTTIYGGSGVNVASGVAGITVTGGVLSFTGSAASALTTTTGSLTLTSADAATWGIGDAATTDGGDLTIKAGGAFGAFNGGNLILRGGAASGTGTGGGVIVRPQTDAAAFQIQTAGGTSLVLVDTAANIVRLSGTDSVYTTIDLRDVHLASSQTTAPAIGVPGNCGTSPSAVITAASTDIAGSFTVTTGGGGTASSCDTTVTFHSSYAAAPKSIIIVGKGGAASANRQPYVSNVTASTMTVSFGQGAGGANGANYSFSYWVVE